MKSTEIQEKLALIPQECKENTDTYKKEPANLNDYITNFHLAIKRHQYLKENKDFPSQYHNARVYITLKILQYNNDLPNIMKKELAKKIGVRQNMISDYERGKRRISPSMAKRLAKFLKIKTERLT